MDSERNPATRRVAVAAGVVGLAVLLAYRLGWFGIPPSMAVNDEAYLVVDAPFTSINAPEEKQLGHRERQLHALKGTGKLPARASDYLDGIIKKAPEGNWRPAAEQLYDFMRAQRR